MGSPLKLFKTVLDKRERATVLFPCLDCLDSLGGDIFADSLDIAVNPALRRETAAAQAIIDFADEVHEVLPDIQR